MPRSIWRNFPLIEPTLEETLEHYIYKTTFGTYTIPKERLYALKHKDNYDNSLLDMVFPWLYRKIKGRWEAISEELIIDIKTVEATNSFFELELTLSEGGKVIANPRVKIVFLKDQTPKISWSLNPTEHWVWDFQWAWIIIPEKDYCYWKKTEEEGEDIGKHKGKRKSKTKRELVFLGKFNTVEFGTSSVVELWKYWLMTMWRGEQDVCAGSDCLFNKASVIVFFPTNQLNIDPTTVGTTTTNYALWEPEQRKTFYAVGRFWVFWSDGTNMVYATSTDGITWTSPTVIRACTRGDKFSIWFDGTYLHYAYSDYAYKPLHYRRGTPNADGTITWSAPEQTVYDVATDTQYQPFVAVDSEGYPFIACYRAVDTDLDGKMDFGYPTVFKSSTKDGTWVEDTAKGFPYDLDTTGDVYLRKCILVPLTLSKIYAIYNKLIGAYWYLFGKLWDGTTWGTEEQASTDPAIEWSACASDDNVGLAYLEDVNYHVRFVLRTYGVGWGSIEDVALNQTGVEKITEASPQLSGFNGDFFCFWERNNKIYFKRRIAGVWDADPTLWVSEYVYPWSVTSDHRMDGGLISVVWVSTETVYVDLTPVTQIVIRHHYVKEPCVFLDWAPIRVYYIPPVVVVVPRTVGDSITWIQQ